MFSEAVAAGVGMAGCHGRDVRRIPKQHYLAVYDWLPMGRPSGKCRRDVPRIICKKSSHSPLVQGMEDFDVTSEQYYIHVDPAINVLAVTEVPTVDGYHAANGRVEVPVVYTKMWGKGKVFYNSLGHQKTIFDIPQAKELMRQSGFLWAAR